VGDKEYTRLRGWEGWRRSAVSVYTERLWGGWAARGRIRVRGDGRIIQAAPGPRGFWLDDRVVD